MKIITEPNVHILAMPIFFPHPEYELPDIPEENKVRSKDQEHGNYYAHYPKFDAARITAHAGKGCYDSYGKDGRSIKDHINTLRSTRHGSVFEHVYITLFLSGISRGLSHEFVRHRHIAISQRSTRYTAEEGAAIVLDPFFAELYKNKEKLNPHALITLNTFLESCETSLEKYKREVELLNQTETSHQSKVEKRKWARGKARQLLPHALETRITATANIRTWRWFIELRSERSAEPEIRRLAYYIFEKLNSATYLMFDDFSEGFSPDNIPELAPEFSKI